MWWDRRLGITLQQKTPLPSPQKKNDPFSFMPVSNSKERIGTVRTACPDLIATRERKGNVMKLNHLKEVRFSLLVCLSVLTTTLWGTGCMEKEDPATDDTGARAAASDVEAPQMNGTSKDTAAIGESESANSEDGENVDDISDDQQNITDGENDNSEENSNRENDEENTIEEDGEDDIRADSSTDNDTPYDATDTAREEDEDDSVGEVEAADGDSDKHPPEKPTDDDAAEDNDPAEEVSVLTPAEIHAKVEASVWQHFEEGAASDGSSVQAGLSETPLRFVVFHRMEEQYRLNNVAFGEATESHLTALAYEVASQQTKVAEQVEEYTHQMGADQTSLNIVRRSQYNNYVVMESMNRSDVEWLAGQDWVTEIREDKMNELHTVEGRALTGSDDVERRGFDGDGIGIAIIDGHFDLSHPELGGSTTIPNGVVSGAANLEDPTTSVHSTNSHECYHGTGTLSIARRYAPEADMYALTVFPDYSSAPTANNSASDSTIASAIEWCVTNRNGLNGGAPIRIISMSLGRSKINGICSNTLVTDAIDLAAANGIVVFASSGNNGYADGIGHPACARNAIAVGSVWDENNASYTPFAPANCQDANRLENERTCYSNTCSKLDIYAPSEEVICARCGGGTAPLGGTSSACPAAAGMTAQLFEAAPALSGDRDAVLALYQDTGVQVIGDSTKFRIDLEAAVDKVLTGGCTPEASSSCFNGDVYWYDSCGNPGAVKEDCNGRGCSSGVCQTASIGDTYYASDTPLSIPDDSPWGVSSAIAVYDSTMVTSAAVDIDISHSYIGDLTVTLTCPNGAVQILHSGTGGGDDDIKDTFSITACNGQSAAGIWRIAVVDGAAADVGTLNSWVLRLNQGGETIDPEDEIVQQSGDTPMAIPDNDPTGIVSSIPLSSNGIVNGITVDVDITHTYISDLTVSLVCPDGVSTVLHDQIGGSADDIHETYVVHACDGLYVAGVWQLRVNDHASADTGFLDSWALHMQVQ